MRGVTVKVVEVCPSGTVTVVGSGKKYGLPLIKVTDHPPTGAGPQRLIVQVAGIPAVTVPGFTEIVFIQIVVTLRVVVVETPPDVAVTSSVKGIDHILGDDIVNVPVVEPAGTVQVAGTAT